MHVNMCLKRRVATKTNLGDVHVTNAVFSQVTCLSTSSNPIQLVKERKKLLKDLKFKLAEEY